MQSLPYTNKSSNYTEFNTNTKKFSKTPPCRQLMLSMLFSTVLPYQSQDSINREFISHQPVFRDTHVCHTCVILDGRRRHTCNRDIELPHVSSCRCNLTHICTYAWESRWRRTRHMPAYFIPDFESGHTLHGR